jgi:Uma2 family endonuclease
MIEILEKEKLLSAEDYHKLEEIAKHKSEFRNGKLVAMPGGSSNHADIIGNIYMTLRLTLKKSGKKFRVFNSELKVFLAAYNQNVYPDSFVVTEKPKYVDNKFSVSNPTLIVEVLSESTAHYDRSRKFLKYKSLPSFTEYVLIEQDVPMVDVITKKDGNWIIKSYVGLEDTVILESIGCQIKMQDIYENVEDLESPQGIFDFEEKVD